MAVPNNPITRKEQYLNNMATGSGNVPPEPITRTEMFLAKAIGQDVDTPTPVTREEMYLASISGGGGGDADEKFRALINRTITEVEDDTITWLKARVFDGCTLLNKVKLPNVTGINGYVFSNVPANLSFQSLESLYGYAFHTSKATAIDLNGNVNFYIQVSCFQNAPNLSTLVLRRTSKVVSLANINAFSGTRFASGGSGGTLYVPQSMIEGYQSATNWSTILEYENNKILPIEGSIYETQYADGTPIT